MMKKYFARFAEISEDEYDPLGVLLLLPLFVSVTDIYKALWALIVIINILLLNVGLSVVLKRFNNLDITSISILLSGAVMAVFINGFANFVDNIGIICVASVIFAQFIYIKHGREYGGIAKDIKNLSMSLIKYYLPVLLISFVRELLSSGRLFAGYTQNGIGVFSHKFGEYINTASGLFLILAILFFAISVFTKKHLQLTAVKSGAFAVLTVCFLIASIIILSVIGLSKITVISRLAMIAPFILCSILYLCINEFIGARKSAYISLFVLMSALIVIFNAKNILQIWVLLIVFYAVVLIVCIYTQVITKRYNNQYLYAASVLLFASVISYIFETILTKI